MRAVVFIVVDAADGDNGDDDDDDDDGVCVCVCVLNEYQKSINARGMLWQANRSPLQLLGLLITGPVE